MKKLLGLMLLLGVFIVPSFINCVAAEDELNIVVINAYHYGYKWTYNNNQGLREEIFKAYPNANIYTEFLDWKRFPSRTLIEGKYHEYSEKYAEINVDLLLTTDDMGLEFALDHREELFDDAPIAFSGIIGHTAELIIGNHQQVTGVFEEMRPEGAFELMELLQPDVTDIVMIHDTSESGLRTAEAFYMAADQLGIRDLYNFHDWQDKTYDEILEDVTTLDDKTAIMFFSYNRSVDGVMKSSSAFSDEVSAASAVPMYSNAEEMLDYGLTGGSFLSGVLQGKALGLLGVRILEGENPDDLAFIDEATVYKAVDENQLIRYGLDKKKLSEDVQIVNEHVSFFETYRMLVYTVGGILLALMTFIVILLRQHWMIKGSERDLLNQKSELQDFYEQVHASEEELRSKNEQLEDYQKDLEYEVKHDQLTKLPNRISLKQYVSDLLVQPEMSYKKVVFIYIDLDNFKFVNNTYGHHFGDQVLMAIGERLKGIDDGLFVSRTGGDEFVVVNVFEETTEDDTLQALMVTINQTITQPIMVEEERVMVKASIGYSVYPEDGGEYDQLITEADTAMYHAKKEGKSASRHYRKTMKNVFQNEYIMIKNLKEAYIKEEFYLMFQPIMSAEDNTLDSYEALVRWHSPIHGHVSPDVFIGLAETSGLIIPIGYYIIDKALEFAKKICLDKVKVSINISVVQFYDEDFEGLLLRKIRKAGLVPDNVQIEITESVMIEGYGLLIDKLNYLREKGIQIALDDFGTGYSSLAYLHELPINKLKIDKVFIDAISDENIKSPLVDATVNLAKNFGLIVIAEGVETIEQLNYLRRIQCDCIQGYYFSKPLLEEEALAYCEPYCHKHE